MAMSVTGAPAVLLNQTTRDKAIAVLNDFQAMSQSNSRLPNKPLTGSVSVKTDVDALCTALVAAGAITSFVS
jgi:hypothetical protein